MSELEKREFEESADTWKKFRTAAIISFLIGAFVVLLPGLRIGGGRRWQWQRSRKLTVQNRLEDY